MKGRPSTAKAACVAGPNGMAEAMPFQSYPEPNFIRVSLRVALAHEIANRRVRGGQRLFVGQENDAEVFRPRTLAET